MAITMVQEAFSEGRTTDTDWIVSKAKGDQAKLQAFIDNQQHFNAREFRAIRPLLQLDPDSGEVLRSFPSRLAAAKWVVAHVLKNPDRDPVSMTGNFMTCMELGYKCYGYYWKEVTQAEYETNVQERSKAVGGKAIWAYGHQRGRCATGEVFVSIKEASRKTGVAESTIRANLHDCAQRVNGVSFREYNPKPIERHFYSAVNAAIALGVTVNSVIRKFQKNQPINNIIIKLEVEPKRGIVQQGIRSSAPASIIIVNNGKRGKTIFASAKSVGRYLGCAGVTVSKHLREGTVFKGKYRFIEVTSD